MLWIDLADRALSRDDRTGQNEPERVSACVHAPADKGLWESLAGRRLQSRNEFGGLLVTNDALKHAIDTVVH
jgi:hypothetical protein